MNSRRTIWLVRHANRRDFVDADWLASAQRPHDPPASDDGRMQARDLARRLVQEDVTHLFASPFLRAVQTAAIVAEALGLSMNIEPGLCEALRSDWFSRPPDWVPPAKMRRLARCANPCYRPVLEPIYPESSRQTQARADRLVAELCRRHDGNLLLVTHGQFIANLCASLIGRGCGVRTGMCCLIELRQMADGRWGLHRDGSDTGYLSRTERVIRWQ